MKNFFPLLLFAFSAFSSHGIFCQEKASIISNQKSGDHSGLPGYNLLLKLPEGFTPAPHFSGWQNKNGSRIILDKKKKSLSETLTETETKLNAENFISEKKNLMINNNPAILIESSRNANFPVEKNILIIEKNDAIYIIESKNNIENNEKNILKKTILTVIFEN